MDGYGISGTDLAFFFFGIVNFAVRNRGETIAQSETVRKCSFICSKFQHGKYILFTTTESRYDRSILRKQSSRDSKCVRIVSYRVMEFTINL